MKKNLLIISSAYPPNNVPGGQRPYALAKYLDKDIYNIKVITCENPDLPLGINKDFNPSLNGVEIILIKSLIGNSPSKLRQKNNNKVTFLSKFKSSIFKIGQLLIFTGKGFFWFPKVKTYLKKNEELILNTDIVFSTSPGVTNHQIARFIKRYNDNIQWIADFRDFNYVENWDSKKGLKPYLHRKLEASIIKEASNLTFVTKTMQTAYQKFYPKYQYKMHAVYNGFDKTNIIDKNNTLNEKGIISFFYAGSFYNGLRSPIPLLQLLDKAFENDLINREKVQIQIAGNIDEEMKLMMMEYNSFDCVDFLGNLPRKEVIDIMSKSTFLWLIIANIKSHFQTVPIKLFEYIAARRPVINFAPDISESSQIIEEKNLGYNFNTLDFSLEKSYPLFQVIVNGAKNNKYERPLPFENLDSFTWSSQIKLIEELL